jgi:hypothetical protein
VPSPVHQPNDPPQRGDDVDPEPGATPGGRTVLDGSFRLLRALPEADPAAQVTDLVARTGLPRPTVHRLLGQLVAVGAVHRTGDTWVLAGDVLRLGARVEPVRGLRAASRPVLRELQRRTSVTACLLVRDGPELVTLEVVPGREELPVSVVSGLRMPAGTAAEVSLRPWLAPRQVLLGDRVVLDDEAVVTGMRCSAIGVGEGGARRPGFASLSLMGSPRYDPSRTSELLQAAATSVARRLREVSSVRRS